MRKAFKLLTLLFLLTVIFTGQTYAQKDEAENLVDEILNSRIEKLDIKNNHNNFKVISLNKKDIDLNNKVLQKINDYDDLVRDRLSRRGLSKRLVKVLENKKDISYEGNNKIIKVKVVYEFEYTINGVVDSEHSMQGTTRIFTFNANDELIDYKTTDKEETVVMKMDLEKARKEEILQEKIEKEEIEKFKNEEEKLRNKNIPQNEIDDYMEKFVSLSNGNINRISVRAKLYSLNRKKMGNYLRSYYSSYNDDYADFSEYGGDCANFASQTIRAGGATFDTTGKITWYYYSSSNRSTSWASANRLYKYLRGNDWIGPQGILETTYNAMKKLSVGDIVFIDFDDDDELDHTTIVSSNSYQVNVNGIRVAAHTTDVYDKPINEYRGTKRYMRLKGYMK